MIVPPGSTIGIIGGGQLGRMLSIAAAQLGYRCHIFDPADDPCAADVSAAHTQAAFDDSEALRTFGEACDVVTYEFENVPVEPLGLLGAKVRPGMRSLEVAQDRAAEKRFIEGCGGAVAPWREVASLKDVETAVHELGGAIVLKTRRFGYDGKGQAWIHSPSEAGTAWDMIGGRPAVAERAIDFLAEFSVIVARWADGQTVTWDAPRNEHRDGILRRSTVPAGEAITHQAEAARAVATAIAAALEHIGVLTMEFFATAEGPLVNEIAPRVHNSGHWTIEGAVTSQFEQHIRAICDLPPGSPALAGTQAVMDNLIGDDVDRWPELVSDGQAHVHIYNKGAARPGRKMGHVTRVRP